MSPSVTVRLLATQSDARLVELARQGHERAFEALVQRHRRPLLSWCRRALLPDARAEDALQQALLQAWLALQRGDEVRDARAWLYRVVHNAALNARRRSGYDYAELSEALSGADAPHEDLDRRIAVREALAGLAALPEQQREALLRTAVEGASHADAAAEMGLTEGALRGLVYRARSTLRTAVTAITPMPLATWAAAAAGHGGGAIAELAAGGGSAGLAGLLAKGGAVAVTAGMLAAGVGTVERHRHVPAHPAPRAAHTRIAAADGGEAPASPALVAVTAPVTQPIAPAASTPGESRRHDGRHGRRHRSDAEVPEATREDAPELLVGPRQGDGEGDGGSESPRHGASEGHGGLHDGGGGPGPGGRHDDGGGPGPGGRRGGDRTPGSGTAPGPGDGGSGSGDSRSGGASGGSDDGASRGGGDPPAPDGVPGDDG